MSPRSVKRERRIPSPICEQLPTYRTAAASPPSLIACMEASPSFHSLSTSGTILSFFARVRERVFVIHHASLNNTDIMRSQPSRGVSRLLAVASFAGGLSAAKRTKPKGAKGMGQTRSKLLEASSKDPDGTPPCACRQPDLSEASWDNYHLGLAVWRSDPLRQSLNEVLARTPRLLCAEYEASFPPRAWYSAQTRYWEMKLSEEQRKAVVKYTKGLDRLTGRVMRGKVLSVEDLVKARRELGLEEETTAAKVEKELKRLAHSIDAAISSAPSSDSPFRIYRGTSKPPRPCSRALQSCSLYSDKAEFYSTEGELTTTARKKGMDPHLLAITVYPGVPCLHIGAHSAYDDEGEVLYRRESCLCDMKFLRLKVYSTSVQLKDGTWNFQLPQRKSSALVASYGTATLRPEACSKGLPRLGNRGRGDPRS